MSKIPTQGTRTFDLKSDRNIEHRISRHCRTDQWRLTYPCLCDWSRCEGVHTSPDHYRFINKSMFASPTTIWILNIYKFTFGFAWGLRNLWVWIV